MITERKTHKLVFQSGMIPTAPGEYTVNVQARDSAGYLSEVQSSNFVLE